MKRFGLIVVATLVLHSMTSVALAHTETGLRARFTSEPFGNTAGLPEKIYPGFDLPSRQLSTLTARVTNRRSSAVTASCLAAVVDDESKIIGSQVVTQKVRARRSATLFFRIEYEASGWHKAERPVLSHCHRSDRPKKSRATARADRVNAGVISQAIVLCRFADHPSTPHPPSYFEGLMSNEYPGIGHYLAAQSFGQMTMQVDEVAGWYDLPKPRSAYEEPAGSFAHAEADMDCAAAADADIFFPRHDAVSFFFNGEVTPNVGPRAALTLDGRSKFYSLISLGQSNRFPDGSIAPSGGYEVQSIVAHEFIHSLGLPDHSEGTYGNEFDSQWDVMSQNSGGCRVDDPVYDCVAPGVIAPFRHLLGWIPASSTFSAPAGTSAVTLQPLAESLPSTGYVWARVAIPGSDAYYSVEVRQRAGYDQTLPGEGVIIHKVLPAFSSTGRVHQPRALVVDGDSDGDPNDEGATWVAGETFRDPSGVMITVTNKNPDGSYEVEVTRP